MSNINVDMELYATLELQLILQLLFCQNVGSHGTNTFKTGSGLGE